MFVFEFRLRKLTGELIGSEWSRSGRTFPTYPAAAEAMRKWAECCYDNGALTEVRVLPADVIISSINTN